MNFFPQVCPKITQSPAGNHTSTTLHTVYVLKEFVELDVDVTHVQTNPLNKPISH